MTAQEIERQLLRTVAAGLRSVAQAAEDAANAQTQVEAAACHDKFAADLDTLAETVIGFRDNIRKLRMDAARFSMAKAALN